MSSSSHRSTLRLVLLGTVGVLGSVGISAASGQAADRAALDHFESKVRPLLVGRCVKCHGPEKAKGGLRLDTAEGVARGGESGAVVVAGDPEASLLIAAVRQAGELKMPPDAKLTEPEIAALAAWIRSGAPWPQGAGAATTDPGASDGSNRPLLPNDPALAGALQAWYKADVLRLADGDPAPVWPDSSGQGRDLTVTRGVRPDGQGQAPRWVAAGAVNRRPAVRFEASSGLATSPDRPVAIRGDAALTIIVVANLQPHDAQPPHDDIVGVGNPAQPGGDPGRPRAAHIQIARGGQHELRLAGGWTHDAGLGPGSFQPLYRRPLLLTMTKTPGPMKATTRFSLNGDASPRVVAGRDTVPDIQHRQDIGLSMGRALSGSGGFVGDVSEVIVFNKALSEAERKGVEGYLAERYAILLPEQRRPPPARFTAEQRRFWAFQPVQDVEPPHVRDEGWPATPLDRFILARLEEQGLKPAQRADKRTLIRRVTFDLTGLPPTPEEIEAFLKDDTAGAFARVVDRLLDSPHYGERWARHWLDAVRYAESTADDANAVMRYAYRYRDYVVDAFNRDLPYDQFLVEQLAGDLLPTTTDIGLAARRVIATGYLMVGPKALAEADKEQSRLDIVDDQIDVTGRTFLGLTLACARCHDHKFDPIPTTDYYALAGIFRSTEVFRDENRNATMWQEWPLFQVPGEPPFTVMAPKEGRPVNLRVHVRGDHFTLGSVVPRRFLQILEGPEAPPIETTQSGRLELARWIARKDNPLTARVMVNRIWQHHFGAGLVATGDNFGLRGERPSHPGLLDWLAARFVAGGWSIKAMHRLMLLSSTYQAASSPDERAQRVDPDNRLLGRMPRRRLEAEELRDAILAVSGQLSRTVGGNAASEFLYEKAENIGAAIRPNRMKADDPFYTTFPRRSLYLPLVRNVLPDSLALFDGADPNGVTALRNDTTVPPQALYLLNNPFVREQAARFAQSLLGDTKARDEDRLRRAYARALGRPPTGPELAEATDFLGRYAAGAGPSGRSEADVRQAAWQSYCQMLYCLNEFLYLD